VRILIASPDLSTQAHVLSSANLIATRANVYREMEIPCATSPARHRWRWRYLTSRGFSHSPSVNPTSWCGVQGPVLRGRIPVGELIRTNYHPGRLASCWAARFVYQPEMKEAAAN
jgi:hypothetical protein